MDALWASYFLNIHGREMARGLATAHGALCENALGIEAKGPKW